MDTRRIVAAALFVIAAASTASARLEDPRNTVRQATIGRASWYGPGFAGRKTASGAIFRPQEMTAAHRTLPLGTVVRVTNLHNGKTVTVRINDRGPFKRHRDLDLSAGAAKAIGMMGRGIASVLIEPL